jgi:pectate lyase
MVQPTNAGGLRAHQRDRIIPRPAESPRVAGIVRRGSHLGPGHCRRNVKLLNNFLANSGTPASRNASSVAAIPYSYTVDANNSVKSIVTSGAGTGKI